MSESDESAPQPRVNCPRCGKRFRVDPAVLAEKPEGAPARCRSCKATFMVQLAEDGSAEIVPDEAKRLPHELSHKYLGIDPPAEKDDETRLIIRIVPRRVVAFSA